MEEYKISNLNIKYLFSSGNKKYPQRLFKKATSERAMDLGKIFYKGYTISDVIYKNKKRQIIRFIFKVEGKQFERGKRQKYIQILEIPLFEKMENPKFGTIFEEIPAKIFSSDPSFQFFLAYALNKNNAVVLNDFTKKHLGIALTKKPIFRNPKLKTELNKHFYKMVKFLKNQKFKYYYNKKYFLGYDN